MLKRRIFMLGLIGCSFQVPSALDENSYLCQPEDSGPNCNGDKRKGECDAAGLPSAWAFDSLCHVPVRPSSNEHGDTCLTRFQSKGRGCIVAGDLTCCPE